MKALDIIGNDKVTKRVKKMTGLDAAEELLILSPKGYLLSLTNPNYMNMLKRVNSEDAKLSYEVNVESDNGNFMWEKIIEIGKDFAIQPYGTEALSTLRIEMGHVAGSELDGRTIPYDNGLDGLVSKKKDFIGKRSLTRSDTTREDRKQLVGIVPLDKSQFIEEGQHIVECENLPIKIKTPIEYLGHISSSYHSPNLNHCISMAMIKSGNKLMGKKLFVSTSKGNKNIPVEIVNSVFLDPENKRLLS